MHKLNKMIYYYVKLGGITMKNKKSGNSKVNSDPASSNYAKEIRNRGLENTPCGEDEPSTKTDYK